MFILMWIAAILGGGQPAAKPAPVVKPVTQPANPAPAAPPVATPAPATPAPATPAPVTPTPVPVRTPPAQPTPVTPPVAGSAGRMVALGDSYSSGSGSEIMPVQGAKGVLDTKVILACGRSTNNAARQVAAARGYALSDASCGGSTTDNILTKGMNGEPAQITAVTPDTKLVTLTIGGNDAALLFLHFCAKGGSLQASVSCFWGFDAVVKDMQNKVTAMGPKVANTLAEIRKRAPQAQIRIAGYPYLLPAPGAATNCTWASEHERQVAKDVQDRANGLIKAAAEAAGPGVRYVDPHAANSPFDAVDEFGTRDTCSRSQNRWINGDIDTNAVAPVHPNAKGYQYYAQLYLASL